MFFINANTIQDFYSVTPNCFDDLVHSINLLIVVGIWNLF